MEILRIHQFFVIFARWSISHISGKNIENEDGTKQKITLDTINLFKKIYFRCLLSQMLPGFWISNI